MSNCTQCKISFPQFFDLFHYGDHRVCEKCQPAFWAEYCREQKCAHCEKQFQILKSDPQTRCGDCHPKFRICENCKDEFLFTHFTAFCEICECKRRASKFWRTIPPLYESSVIERVPCQQQAKIIIDYDWYAPDKDGDFKTGIWAWGDSGGGKTRTMYLAARGWLKDGSFETVAVIRGQEFGHEVVERTRPDGKGGLGGYIRDLMKADLLCIDEVDKISLSPRVSAEFFDLFERRIANEKFMLFTSNISRPDFAKKFAEESRDAVGRRVAEFFIEVHYEL